MSNKHLKGLGIIATLLVITGLVLMFSSISFATSIGESYLLNQEDGITDTNYFNMIVETYKSNFIITGSILFGAGLFTAIVTYFIFLRYESSK